MKIQRIVAKDYDLDFLNIPDSPAEIFGLGEVFKDEVRVAVVGSRKFTAYGRKVTESIVRELVSHGVCIVSGLALGIDSIAHTTAIKNNGRTIAVLPTDLSHIYPASHRGLAKQILATGGALVSEYEQEPRGFKGNFHARNRIVSGLSKGVIVTEAAERSGSMITARLALEQGRELFVVPGPIDAPSSRGCNNLIKAGAHLITSGKDVLEILGIESSEKRALKGANPQQQTILDLMHSGISDGEELQTKSGLVPAMFSQQLTMLEIQGAIRPLGSNQWSVL